MATLLTPPLLVPYPDLPMPGGANDYEFEATTSSLPSGFGWVNQGTSTYAEAAGTGTIAPAVSGGAGESLRLITKTLPAGNWTMIAKIALSGSRINWSRGGLCLRESSSGKLIELSGAKDVAAGNNYFTIQRWTNPTTFLSATAATAALDALTPYYYLKIKKNSTTSFDFSYSFDGVVYISLLTAHDPSAFFTMNEYGVLTAQRTGTGQTNVYYIRFS